MGISKKKWHQAGHLLLQIRGDLQRDDLPQPDIPSLVHRRRRRLRRRPHLRIRIRRHQLGLHRVADRQMPEEGPAEEGRFPGTSFIICPTVWFFCLTGDEDAYRPFAKLECLYSTKKCFQQKNGRSLKSLRGGRY